MDSLPIGYMDLCAYQQQKSGEKPCLHPLKNGGTLVTVPNVRLIQGWNRTQATVLFVLPPAFPLVPADNFWVEPGFFRLANGRTPKSTNESNPIPGDYQRGRQATWFGWHLQTWDPNRLNLKHIFHWVQNRLGILQ